MQPDMAREEVRGRKREASVTMEVCRCETYKTTDEKRGSLGWCHPPPPRYLRGESMTEVECLLCFCNMMSLLVCVCMNVCTPSSQGSKQYRGSFTSL